MSTYIMAGAFIAGLCSVIAICITILAGGRPYQSEIPLKGNAVQITPIPTFAHIDINASKRGRNYTVDNFRGVTIEESDSVDSPIILTTEAWIPAIKAIINGDSLKLNVNLDAVYDSLDTREFIVFEAANVSPIKVVIPKNMLSSATSTGSANTLYFNSVSGNKLIINVNNRIVLDNCDIDTLISTGRQLTELKLDNSRIEVTMMKAMSTQTSINCCDGSGNAGKLIMTPDKPGRIYELDLNKAVIKELSWEPADTTMQLDLTLNRRFKFATAD